jgi:riboflavin kinase/FMN adenylyltransferase
VAALGVFDGVHLGHRAVIREATEAARQRGWQAGIVTFDRNPASVVSSASVPAITSLDHRLRLFDELGVELCVVVRFDAQAAAMAASNFLRQVVGDFMGVRLLVLGFDCRFGHNRQGDVELCRSLGREIGFEVRVVPAVLVNGEPVHSTEIRWAIQSGDMARAESLLGRPFSLFGTVVPGEGRGRELGYPTANLDLHNEATPPDGVYACLVFANGDPWPGVLSIGPRATFHDEATRERIAEVHLLTGGGDLYGRSIEVRLAGRLRGQRQFDDADKLREQITRDVERAWTILRPKRR